MVRQGIEDDVRQRLGRKVWTLVLILTTVRSEGKGQVLVSLDCSLRAFAHLGHGMAHRAIPSVSSPSWFAYGWFIVPLSILAGISAAEYRQRWTCLPAHSARVAVFVVVVYLPLGIGRVRHLGCRLQFASSRDVDAAKADDEADMAEAGAQKGRRRRRRQQAGRQAGTKHARGRRPGEPRESSTRCNRQSPRTIRCE